MSMGSEKNNNAVCSESRVEQHILKFSVSVALLFAVLGLVWGMLSRSQMIMFDSLYSFVSVILSSLSVYVAWSIKLGDDANFPLGRAQMEPMVVALKSLVITSLCLIALVRAIMSLFSSGQEIDALSAMTYAVIATAACIGSSIYIAWQRKKAKTSALVKAEYTQWFMDTLLSVAVLVGFFAAAVLQHKGYDNIARYMDPLMVVIASTLFIRMPIKSFIESMKDLLCMAPGGDIYRDSEEVVEDISKKHGFKTFGLSISKAGREFTCKIRFISKSSEDTLSLVGMDRIREEVEKGLQTLYDSPIWLRVYFTYDKG